MNPVTDEPTYHGIADRENLEIRIQGYGASEEQSSFANENNTCVHCNLVDELCHTLGNENENLVQVIQLWVYPRDVSIEL